MAHLADYSTDNKYRATVKSTQRLTPAEADEIREIVLEVEPGFECEIDQGFGVLVEAKGDLATTFTTACTAWLTSRKRKVLTP